MIRRAGLAIDLLRAQWRRGPPFKLTYIVTEECSCRCAVCNLWRQPRPGATLPEIRRLFAANRHLSWINLSGGEVVDRDDFPAIVAAALEETRVFVVDFPTAGQRPADTEAKVRAVLTSLLPRLFVSISVDGPPEMHDRLRGTPGAFARALETFARLRRIRDRRLTAQVGLTFSSRNDADPEGLVSALLAAAPGVSREDLHFNVAHHAPHYYRNRAADAPDPRRTAAFLRAEPRQRRGLSPFALLESAYWRLAARYLEQERPPLACAALAASAFVGPDLRLYPCATWDRPLVDLREVGYSLVRAVALAEVRAARADAAARRCPGCFTPCEAYPTLLSRAPATLLALARAGTAPAARPCARPAESLP